MHYPPFNSYEEKDLNFIETMKKYNVKSYEYYFLKTNWKSILMNSNKLSKKEKVDSKTGEVYTFKERFFNDLMIFPELYEAYMIKDDFLYYEKKNILLFNRKVYL